MTGGRAAGTSIRIYLADGTADGVWVVEKSNWTGKGLMASRTQYKELRGREDLDGPGVYVLVGPTDSGVPPSRVYIGETDDLRGRLDSHNASKDFWNRVIVFTSKDENLNKAHIRYLEFRLIALAHEVKRAEVENGNKGSSPRLSEPDEAEAEAFLADMLLIYPVLGLQAFEPIERPSSSTVRLYLKGPDAAAEGFEAADGFVVYAGSKARADEVESIHAYGVEIRRALMDEGVVTPSGPSLVFQEDYTFPSPSQAAMVVLGRTANGRVEWKTSDGVTLKSLQTAGTASEGE